MRLESNPALRKIQKNTDNYAVVNTNATVGGVAIKSAIFCVMVIVASIVTSYLLQNAILNNNEKVWTILTIGMVASVIPMVIISIVISFKPRLASFLGSIYCILNGIMVGFLAGIVDMVYPGIALLALLGTCVVFLVTLTMFKLMGSRLSNKFLKFFLIASVSMLILFAVSFLLRMIFPAIDALYLSAPWLQLLVSAICIIWASITLMVDFNSITMMTEAGVDKSYEWLLAFSLTTTLVWLYVEILELLVKLAMIFGKDN